MTPYKIQLSLQYHTLLYKKGVPASSAAVERMFNISGHIFTNRRRKTGIALFQNLVFLKLNEQFLL